MIGVAAHSRADIGEERLIAAYFAEILKTEQHILAPPHIPAGKFALAAVCGDAPVGVLPREELAHAFLKYRIKLAVLRVGADKARPAHQLAPVFASPAAVAVVCLGAEHGGKAAVERAVAQLCVADEFYGVVEYPVKMRTVPVIGNKSVCGKGLAFKCALVRYFHCAVPPLLF